MAENQPPEDPGPQSKTEWLILTGFLAVFLVPIILELWTNPSPRVVAALFFLFWWMPLLFLHEFGHAAMAKILGWRVKGTVLGIGPTLWMSNLYGAPVEWKLFPIEGFVLLAPKNTQGARWKHALIYFAGPGIELLLFAGLVMIIGPERFFSLSDDLWMICWQALGYAALVGAVINLIPSAAFTGGGEESPNDGLGLIKCFFASPKAYEDWVVEEQREQRNKGNDLAA